jgi:hypothetical protein
MKARKMGRVDAARVIVDQLMEMFKRPKVRSKESEYRM